MVNKNIQTLESFGANKNIPIINGKQNIIKIYGLLI